MKLWLDDNTHPPDESWHWAVDAGEAMVWLKREYYDEVSLDHDLGTELDGMDVLMLIYELSVNDENYQPPRVIGIHTANPVERIKMIATAQNIRDVDLVTAESKIGQRF